MLKDEKQKVWADAVYINFPNQNNRGAHTLIFPVWQWQNMRRIKLMLWP